MQAGCPADRPGPAVRREDTISSRALPSAKGRTPLANRLLSAPAGSCLRDAAHCVKLLLLTDQDGPIQDAGGDPDGEPLAGDEVGEAVAAGLAMPLDFLPVDIDVAQFSLEQRAAELLGVLA